MHDQMHAFSARSDRALLSWHARGVWHVSAKAADLVHDARDRGAGFPGLRPLGALELQHGIALAQAEVEPALRGHGATRSVRLGRLI